MTTRSKLASILLVAMTLFIGLGAATYSTDSHANGNRSSLYK